jgi:hypothetical protein
MHDSPARLSAGARLRLAVRVLARYRVVRARIRRTPLPELATTLARPSGIQHAQPPARLSRAVDRTLRFGRDRPRCLTRALVLYSLLHEQGDAAELVVGLPEGSTGHAAHAWVELGGRDVGPPPGSRGHVALARFTPNS